MYKIIENYFSFKDERGEIKGLINFDNWQEVNYIKSFKGSIRGNHYHKQTKEAIIVLEGEIKVNLQKDSQKEEIDLKKGDVILIEPMTRHTFTMKTDSSWINLLTIKNDEKSPDIYK